jgi:pimeloyl-ACP methyl ester carboxylesterase
LVSPYCTGGLWLGLKALYVFYPKNMKQKYRLLDLLYADYTKYLNNPEWVKMNEQQLAFQLANWKNMKTLFKSISNIGESFRIRKYQKDFQVPFMLLVGKHDGSISSKHSLNAFNRWYPNGLNYYLFENSGHLSFEEEPDLFVQKVVEFVKK